ncbi:MAG: EF-P beta-lysylation protein EpmB [Lysobacteraceae bacterium]
MITASSQTAQSTLTEQPHSPDWRQQYRQAITDPHELLQMLGLTTLASRLAVELQGFPMRVPRSYAARMRHGDADDPLLRQVLPLDDENRLHPGYGFDAVGDHNARTAQGVLQKYHGRALLIATGSCAIHCRYCFRRHFPYAQDIAAASDWQEALHQLRRDESISEVILSGGDPLALATHKLRQLSDALNAIPHIHRLRIHTRLPIVLPARVDDEFCAWLQSVPQKTALVLHANHAQELDLEVIRACQRLRQCGTVLLNQAVLLRGVNDEVGSLRELSERLFDAGVLPYYLHQLDRVHGTAHFAVDDDTALQLCAQLRRQLPGYLVPRLVREIEGEASKTPLGEGQFT